MHVRLKSHREIRAAGSVLEIWPTGNYIEHLPKGTPQQRIGQCWHNVGIQLQTTLKVQRRSKHEG